MNDIKWSQKTISIIELYLYNINILYNEMYINDDIYLYININIRRRLYVLERPLVTARGNGKSYIYAKFNPKYVQYALTHQRP